MFYDQYFDPNEIKGQEVLHEGRHSSDNLP